MRGRVHLPGELCPRCKYDLSLRDFEQCPECEEAVAHRRVIGATRALTRWEREWLGEIGLGLRWANGLRVWMRGGRKDSELARSFVIFGLIVCLLMGWHALMHSLGGSSASLQLTTRQSPAMLLAFGLGCIMVGAAISLAETLRQLRALRRRVRECLRNDRLHITPVSIAALGCGRSFRGFKHYLCLQDGGVLAVREGIPLRLGCRDALGCRALLAFVPRTDIVVAVESSGDAVMSVGTMSGQPRSALSAWAIVLPSRYLHDARAAFRNTKKCPCFIAMSEGSILADQQKD
jgi:hypothetical protein